jgi:hypothetical protein
MALELLDGTAPAIRDCPRHRIGEISSSSLSSQAKSARNDCEKENAAAFEIE